MFNKIFISSLLLVLVLGCQDWIDVSPKTEVKGDKIFSTEDGFKSALIGVYGRMTNSETYGKNLTYGYVEELTQRYDNYTVGMTPSDEQRAKIYDYKNDTYSKSSINTIWEEMYKTIANINNLIANIEKRGDEVILTKGYRNLMEGEAYALRAFHYFDLLRLWGPIYYVNPEALAIPWRDQLSSDKIPLMPANKVLDKILADLSHAELMLSDDPMNFEVDSKDAFFGQRIYRLNLMAVKALMARVYLYAGDKTNAAKYAKHVIDNSNLSLVKDNVKDVAFKDESLFCLDMFNMEERLMSDWKSTVNMNTELWISTDNIRTVFEFYSIGLNDIRYKNGYGFLHGSNQYMCRKYLGKDFLYKNAVPLIRLSEMYLILSESVQLSESSIYLNQLRNARGISRSNNIGTGITEVERIEYLNKEYQKDFFAEGQWFYFLKRHNLDTFYRCPVEEMRYYTFPTPDDEVEFGDVSN